MANWFTYNGISSASFGLFVSGSNTFVHPERDRSIIEVPGRDGNIVIDNGRYKDVTITYDVFCNDRSKLDEIANWLLAPIQKCTLTDTYLQSGYFRTGIYVGDIQWAMGQLNRNGRCSLSFLCNPHKYSYGSTWMTEYTTEIVRPTTTVYYYNDISSTSLANVCPSISLKYTVNATEYLYIDLNYGTLKPPSSLGYHEYIIDGITDKFNLPNDCYFENGNNNHISFVTNGNVTISEFKIRVNGGAL